MELSTLVRLPRTYKALQRMREILGVVVQYGWGDLVARLGLESTLELSRTWLRFRPKREEVARLSGEERIRLACEQLGPTFVKLGQILATRPDLVPMSLVLELRKLQDDVPPFGSAAAREQVERDLGRPVSELFARFDAEPLAAASIAQVHRARLHSGEEVVVKVRRPGLADAIRTDLDILHGLADLIEENLPETRRFSPRAIVREFARAIEKEVDLAHEAYNALAFARNFEGDPHVHVPRVHLELTSERVLTLEYVEGAKASDLAAIDAAGIDRRALARVGVDFVLQQIFRDGFFHGDPHPGNLFVLPGPVIAPIDMGMMGRLDLDTRDRLLELLAGVMLRDADRIVRLFGRMGLLEDDVDTAALRQDGQDLIDRFAFVPLGSVNVSEFLTRLFEALARHRVRVPPELLLVAKALGTMEGMARELDPELDPVAAMRPFVLRLYLERLADPRFLARDWLAAGRAAGELATALPGDLHRIQRDLARGELALEVRSAVLERGVREQARSANRLAVAVVIAATLLGSSLLLALPSGTTVGPLPLTTLAALVGFALAGAGGLALGFGLLRSGRL